MHDIRRKNYYLLMYKMLYPDANFNFNICGIDE